MKRTRKPLFWIITAKNDLKKCPGEVQDVFGHALDLAQQGLLHSDAKPLTGFHGASVMQIIENYYGDTYRAVYTVKFKHAIYVLHVFQKKSKHGVSTPRKEIELVRTRIKYAEEHYEIWLANLKK